jgi:hypothetical protein
VVFSEEHGIEHLVLQYISINHLFCLVDIELKCSHRVGNDWELTWTEKLIPAFSGIILMKLSSNQQVQPVQKQILTQKN